MAQKLKGVGGVLGKLLSEETPATPSQEIPNPSEPSPTPTVLDRSVDIEPPESRRPGARLGRPPGPQTGQGTRKEKVTLRLDKSLMDDYRDWSWEERCQLGELVERALVAYLEKRPRRRAD